LPNSFFGFGSAKSVSVFLSLYVLPVLFEKILLGPYMLWGITRIYTLGACGFVLPDEKVWLQNNVKILEEM
jgi:hypothetical protein